MHTLERADGRDRSIEQTIVRKVAYRLLPFLVTCYFFAYLDRVNLGFAALTMNQEFNFSPTVFSTGAGIFFIGYFLFEIPSNLALEKFGASRWIARIMVSWGVISVAMALIGGKGSFYVLRFLLGLAEAGFFPGILLYLTYWFPANYRARIFTLFIVAVPVSSTIGSPVSGLLLGLDGILGLRGWQWLFILEGLPAVILGLFAFGFLTDRPRNANWLSEFEKQWLTTKLEAERAAKESVRHLSFRQSIKVPDLWILSLIYFGLVAALYGASFWLPQIVRSFGLSNVQTGFVTAIPYFCSSVVMIAWSVNSDRTRERTWHVAIPFLLIGAALPGCMFFDNAYLVMFLLTLASVGIYSAFALFWTLPAAVLTGGAAAGGMALINSVGNLAGFGGPYVVGLMKEITGEYFYGLLVISIFPLLSAALTIVFGRLRRREIAAAEA
jgi:MFS transporter, ACS family, tartrate transporter